MPITPSDKTLWFDLLSISSVSLLTQPCYIPVKYRDADQVWNNKKKDVEGFTVKDKLLRCLREFLQIKYNHVIERINVYVVDANSHTMLKETLC